MREEPEVFRKYDIRGETPGEIDSELVFQLGRSLGHYWDSGSVAVGRDIRRSSPAFYHAMISGLLSQGCEVTTLGLATTDMTAFITQKGFEGGVQITASHMPPEFGGIKPLNSQGRILSNEEMAEVKEIYVEEEVGSERYGEIKDRGSPVDEYREGLEERFKDLFDTDLSGLSIVVDCSNSVGSLAAPDTLRNLGAEVKIINDVFELDFSAHSPEPSETSTEGLQEKVLEENADLGVIFDGDADRVMFVDEKGNFVDGDIPLALLSRKYLSFTDKIVCSVDTGSTVRDEVEKNNGETVFAPRGAVFTALKCIEEDIVFGGQPNGHLMDREFVPYDSGSLFALLVAGMVSESGKSFSELIDSLESYEVEKFNVQTEEKEAAMSRVREAAEEANMVIEDKFNAIRLKFQNFKALVRPSGSEDLIRVTLESRKLDEEDSRKAKEFIRKHL